MCIHHHETFYFYIDVMFDATCHFSRAFEVNRIAMFVQLKINDRET